MLLFSSQPAATNPLSCRQSTQPSFFCTVSAWGQCIWCVIMIVWDKDNLGQTAGLLRTLPRLKEIQNRQQKNTPTLSLACGLSACSCQYTHQFVQHPRPGWLCSCAAPCRGDRSSPFPPGADMPVPFQNTGRPQANPRIPFRRLQASKGESVRVMQHCSLDFYSMAW